MSSQTIEFKTGYIFVATHEPFNETVMVQVDTLAFPVKVKSVHAAKLRITKHIKDQEKRVQRLTIFDALKKKLRREPTNLEVKHEVNRILNEARGGK